MILEIVAAVILGGLALGIVLEPLLRPGRKPPLMDQDPGDPEDTARGRAVAALREIEFDRETGKLSDADYQLLISRYTAQAVEAMRAEEAAVIPPAPAAAGTVESMIEAKVRALRGAAGAPGCPRCGPRPEGDAVFCSSCGSRLPTGRSCQGCGAAVPPDGQFCEECGRQVAA